MYSVAVGVSARPCVFCGCVCVERETRAVICVRVCELLLLPVRAERFHPFHSHLTLFLKVIGRVRILETRSHITHTHTHSERARAHRQRRHVCFRSKRIGEIRRFDVCDADDSMGGWWPLVVSNSLAHSCILTRKINPLSVRSNDVCKRNCSPFGHNMLRSLCIEI